MINFKKCLLSFSLFFIVSYCCAEKVDTIVFSSLKPANWDIYLFENRGDAPRTLAKHPALDYNAVFSPDGRWIVFTSERSGNADLFALDLHMIESPPLQLTHHFAMDDAACFTPDGTSLVFVSNRDGFADIWQMPFAPDNQSEKQAVNLTKSTTSEFNPSISPDGQSITYCFGQDYNLDKTIPIVWVMDFDGSNQRPFHREISENRVVRGFGYFSIMASPIWGHDRQTVYYQMTGEHTSQIWKGSNDGKIDLPLTPNHLFATSPAWMPNGRLAFSGTREPVPGGKREESQSHIWSINESGDLRLESDGVHSCFAPAFAKDGRMVCHGPGPIAGQPLMRNLVPFQNSGMQWNRTLPDGRTVEIHPIRGLFPALSAEGDVFHTQWIIPESLGESKHSPIAVAKLDGSGMRYYTSPNGDPIWGTSVTRDGKWLFMSIGTFFGTAKDRCDIWKLNTRTGEMYNLTQDQNSNAGFPDVAPDGSILVFRRYVSEDSEGNSVESNSEIFSMKPDGTEIRRLTDSPTADTMPAISPDAKWVVFSRQSGRESFQLVIKRLDGTGEESALEPERKGKVRQADMHPRFSPDGKWIAFTSSRGGFNDEFFNSFGAPQPYGEIWAIPVHEGQATGPAIRLTYDKWENSLPYWETIELN